MANVSIIGGGAAGFFAAIVLAEMSPHYAVTLLEAGLEPLNKVRISGGGRCNVTHACFDPATLVQSYPRGGQALRGAFTRFQPRNTMAWFEQRGVSLKIEADGRVFPTTDDSETIVHCLRRAAAEAGVEVRLRSPVIAIDAVGSEAEPRFQLHLAGGSILESDRVLLATGSSRAGYRMAQTLGHRLIEPIPSLFTFKLDPHPLQDLAGISVAGVGVELDLGSHTGSSSGSHTLKQTGDLLITHWGLSGPAILKLSAWGARILQDAHYQGAVLIHWCFPQTPDQIKATLLEAKQNAARKYLGNYRPFPLPQRLWQGLLQQGGLNLEQRWADLSKIHLQKLVTSLSRDRYTLAGKGVFKDEFVTCGGVDLKEVNFKTLESRCCPGLYFAGEILDIDGITGGFNFQSAWTTAWLAAQGLAGL